MKKLYDWLMDLSDAQFLQIYIPFVLGLIGMGLIGVEVLVSGDVHGLSLSLGTTILGAALTYMLLTLVIGQQEKKEAKEEADKELKSSLIRKMGSNVPDVAVEAVNDLRAYEWLTDGSLKGKNFEEAALAKAQLWNADLHGSILHRANLQGADLSDACLRGAILEEADLRGANLHMAELQHANLKGAALQKARLFGAFLDGARLDRANLQEADLRHSNLPEAVLIETDLRKATLVPCNLQGADLMGADLREATLEDVDMQRAVLFATNLQATKLRGIYFRDATLKLADLQGVYMEHVDLKGATLLWANLQGAIFGDAAFDEKTILPDGSYWSSNSDLQRFTEPNHHGFWLGYRLAGRDLAGMNLKKANLQGACLEQTYLRNANLKGADLQRAVLKFATLLDANLEGANLQEAILNGNTTLPDGIKWTPGTDLTRFTDPKHSNFWRSDDPTSPAYRGEKSQRHNKIIPEKKPRKRMKKGE